VSGVHLYDDARARAFEPFALTRPIGELRAGALLVRERWQRALGTETAGHVTSPHLAGFTEPGAAPVLGGPTLAGGSWLVSSRFAPALELAPPGDVLEADGRVVAVRLPALIGSAELADGAATLDDLAPRDAARATIAGWWMDEVWDYVRQLVPMLESDIPILGESVTTPIPRGAIQVGSHPVFVERGAVVEPSVCFDTTAGPIFLCATSHVQAFTRLVGPLYVGAHSVITTDRIAASSIGDTCKVHGELSNSIIVGHSNKGHDGFVGHSLLGRWVNLGAGTITSNLKNTYGTVQLWTPNGVRDTGMQFLGTLFGDHAKTGIGMRLTTGSVLGAGANVFGSTMPPKAVAPFSWGESGGFQSYRVDKFLEVAERMMARRHVALTEGMRAQLQRAYDRRWTVDA
jgi:UDP-N-acetylglucosamine diphosphorylase / glucose-1-phosphate thymidylyltransferase / UDP-N-acetylgalactosamine diphosphorylase / glucosamine-1-phosphate N-acetyltransferase / galactosamine-1-phosphate N-acetyltransferase